MSWELKAAREKFNKDFKSDFGGSSADEDIYELGRASIWEFMLKVMRGRRGARRVGSIKIQDPGDGDQSSLYGTLKVKLVLCFLYTRHNL